MRKLVGYGVLLAVIIYNLGVSASSGKCPTLSQLYAENNMHLENWEVRESSAPYEEPSISYFSFRNDQKNNIALSIRNIAAESKEAAIKDAYHILSQVSEHPILIEGMGWMDYCVYKTPEGYHLSVWTSRCQ